MNTPDTALRWQNTTAAGRLDMAFELGEKNFANAEPPSRRRRPPANTPASSSFRPPSGTCPRTTT
ncbi:hypothetical protein DIE19_15040 [Burkholderia sp. Bp9126]|nr:hypothetical protein DIE19_15040 [Burkholderia sp. Bp9126]